MKSLFLHTNKLNQKQIKAIESAGFVCVKVESFDEVKIVSKNNLSDKERTVFECAMAAINNKSLVMRSNIIDDFYMRIATKFIEGESDSKAEGK